jgi:hypothetical protein
MTAFEKQARIEKLFKENLNDFFDELIQQYPQEGDLLIMRFFLSEQIPMQDLMNQFIRYVLPLRTAIANRDETFFLERDNIFGASPKDKVVQFKNLYLGMNADDRLVLFEWFDCFVKLADEYVLTMK